MHTLETLVHPPWTHMQLPAERFCPWHCPKLVQCSEQPHKLHMNAFRCLRCLPAASRL